MKRILLLVISVSIYLIGSNNIKNDNSNNNTYLYGTKEYKEIVKKSKISPEEATEIICNSDEYKPFLQHYLIIQDDFIFTTLAPTHAGTLKLIEGLRVNMNTGEISQIDQSTYSNFRMEVKKSIAVKCTDNK
jgi:hypothetical protein